MARKLDERPLSLHPPRSRDGRDDDEDEDDDERSLLLSAIVANAADSILVADDHGRYVFANPAAADMFGCRVDDMLGRRIFDFATIETEARDEWARFLEEGAQTGHFVVRRRDGERRVLEYRARSHILPGRHLSILRDVTDLRAAELRLDAVDERLRALVSNLPVIAFAFDENGIYTLSEGKALAAVGLEPGEIVGQSVFEVYSGRPDIHDCVRRALGGEPTAWSGYVRGAWFDTWLTPRMDASGRVVEVTGVSMDVTEHRHLEQQLRQAEKMEAVGRLAGGVAHDFNNMLSVILTIVSTVLRRLDDDSPLRDPLADVESAASRAADLSNQLLTFASRRMLQPEPHELGALIESLTPMLRTVLGERIGVVIRAPEPAWVSADRTQMEHAIMNLALNARDAMPDGGELRLEVDRTTDGVRLRVTDTGTGMDPKTRARAFEPFFSTKPRDEGTGLGLATVHGIVEQLGGSVSVDSAPGAGSTFTILLPQLEPPPEPD